MFFGRPWQRRSDRASLNLPPPPPPPHPTVTGSPVLQGTQLWPKQVVGRLMIQHPCQLFELVRDSRRTDPPSPACPAESLDLWPQAPSDCTTICCYVVRRRQPSLLRSKRQTTTYEMYNGDLPGDSTTHLLSTNFLLSARWMAMESDSGYSIGLDRPRSLSAAGRRVSRFECARMVVTDGQRMKFKLVPSTNSWAAPAHQCENGSNADMCSRSLSSAGSGNESSQPLLTACFNSSRVGCFGSAERGDGRLTPRLVGWLVAHL